MLVGLQVLSVTQSADSWRKYRVLSHSHSKDSECICVQWGGTGVLGARAGASANADLSCGICGRAGRQHTNRDTLGEGFPW